MRKSLVDAEQTHQLGQPRAPLLAAGYAWRYMLGEYFKHER